MQIFAQLPHSTLEITTGTIAGLPDERLRHLATYWVTRHSADSVPARSAIDPLDFPALLPNIMLIERVMENGSDRYRFRLAGTDIARYTGRELTGCFLDDVVPADYHEYVRQMNRVALTRRRPVYSSSLYHDKGDFVNAITYRLIMPLVSGSARPAEPDLLFVCQFWQRRAEPGAWNGDWRSVMPEIRVIEDA
ncbi:PAS domain-containing protein [Ferrovibrio terrae]|uniref:PAS domain-containing protein n=1 Tax=Ferrovibrio terrae TaxID=2594003 RepID=A0A516H5X3_9PROT|nr:PAS domain-containing protein [Ferrovibrio terrae]QDO99193.1 PAS domain-containing protein [Ferrovibrio terrae]